jgi:inhibitor of cysteine peptidase
MSKRVIELFNQDGGRMKTKLMIVLGILTLLAACTPNKSVYTDPGAHIIVNKGDQFSIELPSNITTGYSWEFATSINTDYLTVVQTDYINPDTKLEGAGGTQVWIFKANQPGSTTIQLEYKRPWEVDVPAIKTALFEVTIQ